jgi:hypothetical protein
MTALVGVLVLVGTSQLRPAGVTGTGHEGVPALTAAAMDLLVYGPLTLTWLLGRVLSASVTSQVQSGHSGVDASWLSDATGYFPWPTAHTLGAGLDPSRPLFSLNPPAVLVTVALALVVAMLVAAVRGMTGTASRVRLAYSWWLTAAVFALAGLSLVWLTQGWIEVTDSSSTVTTRLGLDTGATVLGAAAVGVLVALAARFLAMPLCRALPRMARVIAGRKAAPDMRSWLESNVGREGAHSRGRVRLPSLLMVAPVLALLLVPVASAVADRVAANVRNPQKTAQALADAVLAHDTRAVDAALGRHSGPAWADRQAIAAALPVGSTAHVTVSGSDGAWQVGEADAQARLAFRTPDGITLTWPVRLHAEMSSALGAVHTPTWHVIAQTPQLAITWTRELPSDYSATLNGVPLAGQVEELTVLPGVYRAVGPAVGFLEATNDSAEVGDSGALHIGGKVGVPSSATQTALTRARQVAGSCAGTKVVTACGDARRQSYSDPSDPYGISSSDSSLWEHSTTRYSWSIGTCIAQEPMLSSANSATVTATCPVSLSKSTTYWYVYGYGFGPDGSIDEVADPGPITVVVQAVLGANGAVSLRTSVYPSG